MERQKAEDSTFLETRALVLPFEHNRHVDP